MLSPKGSLVQEGLVTVVAFNPLVLILKSAQEQFASSFFISFLASNILIISHKSTKSLTC